MESVCNKNYLFTLFFLTLLLFNSAQAVCVKKNSQSTQVRAASSPHSASSPSSPSPGSDSSPPTPPTQSTPSSSSPSPAQSTSQSSSPSSESTPSSSSPSPTQSIPSSDPSTPQSPSSSPEPSIKMQSTSSSPTPSTQAPSQSSETSFQVQPLNSSAGQKPPSQSTPDSTFKTQAVSVQTAMDSPDGAVPASISPTGSAPDIGDSGFKISAAVSSNAAVNKICQSTDYPPLCLESVSPFFDGRTDVMQVLAMAINGSYAQTELAMKSLGTLANKPGNPPTLAAALQDCKENFEDALDNFEAAYVAIAQNDIGTIKTMLSAALTDYVTCADGIPGPESLTLQSEKLNKMVGNCLAIAALHKP